MVCQRIVNGGQVLIDCPGEYSVTYASLQSFPEVTPDLVAFDRGARCHERVASSREQTSRAKTFQWPAFAYQHPKTEGDSIDRVGRAILRLYIISSPGRLSLVFLVSA